MASINYELNLNYNLDFPAQLIVRQRYPRNHPSDLDIDLTVIRQFLTDPVSPNSPFIDFSQPDLDLLSDLSGYHRIFPHRPVPSGHRYYFLMLPDSTAQRLRWQDTKPQEIHTRLTQNSRN